MLRTLVFTSVLILKLATAQAMLFKSVEATEETLQKEALRRNQPTYAQWYLETKLEDAAEPHAQVTEFAHEVLQSPQKLSKQKNEDWMYLRSVVELNRADREMLFLLAQKIRDHKEMCRYLLLEKELMPELYDDCQKQARPVPEGLRKHLQARDVLVIDGKAFQKDQIPARLISGSYQWKIVSSEYQDRRFTGSAETFFPQKLPQVSWVEGTCENPKLNLDDFAVLAQASIVFSKACVTPGLQTHSSLKSWVKEHETLLWTVGLVVGGLAAYHLKDKDVIINWPR